MWVKTFRGWWVKSKKERYKMKQEMRKVAGREKY